MKQLNLYWLGGGGGSSVPDGRTVTPVNDVTLLQQCAGIANPTYTLLSQILADTGMLQTILSNQNAVNYLVRCKDFIKSKALVPTMTSDTTPEGECIGHGTRTSANYHNWNAFDGAELDRWSGEGTDSYVGYHFTEKRTIARFSLVYVQYNYSSVTFEIQGSDNGTDWTTIDVVTLTNPTTSVVNQTYSRDLPKRKCEYIRVLFPNNIFVGGGNFFMISELQFYSEEGFCESDDAMRYIGLNNYASNTLLADSTWCDAICNSTYFERVLNVKHPTMTSNTTPSGVASCNNYSSGYEAYKAFDYDNATCWAGSSSSAVGDYVRYNFPGSPFKAYLFKVKWTITVGSKIRIQGSSDNGANWTQIYEYTTTAYSANETAIVMPNDSYNCYRVIVVDKASGQYSEYGSNCYWFDIYGRKDV